MGPVVKDGFVQELFLVGLGQNNYRNSYFMERAKETCSMKNWRLIDLYFHCSAKPHFHRRSARIYEFPCSSWEQRALNKDQV
jgi:hypothetical protein